MGIRASYWATGGILTVLGVGLAQLLLPALASAILAIAAFLLKATLLLGAILAVVLVIAVVRRSARRRRRAAEA